MSHTGSRRLSWTRGHTLTTTAAPAQVWALWSQPLSWPHWDHDLAEVTSVGPFERGSRGTIKPVTGPRTTFVFTVVDEGSGFTSMSPLPLATLTLAHRLRPLGGGTEFTHTITITGLGAPLFARLIGRGLAAGLPEAMSRLAELAEGAGATGREE